MKIALDGKCKGNVEAVKMFNLIFDDLSELLQEMDGSLILFYLEEINEFDFYCEKTSYTQIRNKISVSKIFEYFR